VVRGNGDEEEKMEVARPPLIANIFDSTCWGFYFAGIGRKISPGLRLRRLLENMQEAEPIVGFDRWRQDYDVALGEWQWW